MTRINILDRIVKTSVRARCILQRHVGILALFDGGHHLAETYEFVPDDLILFVQRKTADIPFGEFQITGTLRLGAVGGTGLAS